MNKILLISAGVILVFIGGTTQVSGITGTVLSELGDALDTAVLSVNQPVSPGHYGGGLYGGGAYGGYGGYGRRYGGYGGGGYGHSYGGYGGHSYGGYGGYGRRYGGYGGSGGYYHRRRIIYIN